MGITRWINGRNLRGDVFGEVAAAVIALVLSLARTLVQKTALGSAGRLFCRPLTGNSMRFGLGEAGAESNQHSELN